MEILEIEQRIRTGQKQMEKPRKIITEWADSGHPEEMGEQDDFKSELQELEKKIKQKRMSKEATTKIRAELKKTKMTFHVGRGHGGSQLILIGWSPALV